MSAEIVNLRKSRKARDRVAREKRAAENRSKFGRTKAERGKVDRERDLAARRIEAHARQRGDDEAGGGSEPSS